MDPLMPLDPLSRELAAAMQVDPSPDFVARVRIRLDAPLRPRWNVVRLALAGSGLVLVVLAWLWLPRTLTVAPTDVAPLADGGRAIWLSYHPPVAPQAVRVPSPGSGSGRAQRLLRSDVQISPSESAAWRRLLAGVDVAAPEPPPRDLEIPQMSIAPLDIDTNKQEGAGR